MAFVTIRIKGSEGYTRTPLDKERMVVGRASAADISLRNTTISREHCALARSGEDWTVEDLGGANGTWVNQQRLPAGGLTALAEGDVVKAGRARLTFHAGALADAGAADAEAAEDEDEPAGPPQRRRGADDPPEACPCATCGAWFSIAHRIAGEVMDCPRCGRPNPVPELVTSP